MVDRMSSEDLRRWMIAKYRQTWLNLDDLMQRGANYLTSDDHEFWNDYPERPLIWAWRALYQSLAVPPRLGARGHGLSIPRRWRRPFPRVWDRNAA